MPIYMDRHDVSKTVTAENVAQLHQADLKIQDKFKCRGLTYWFDENRKTAFCLIEAPNKEAIKEMHDQAHGEVPHRIIEVDEHIVESFLGRIEDPEKAQKTELNIINDPAFRVIMVIETGTYLSRLEANQFSVFSQKFHHSVAKTLKKYNGRLVKKDNYNYLVSFKSVTNAVFCALNIQQKFKYVTPKFDSTYRILKIALSSGIPVTDKEIIFEEVITLAKRMCEFVEGKLVISSEVKELYESENRKLIINESVIRAIKPSEENFLNQLIDFIENNWNRPNFNVDDFSKDMGLSKSQLYRKLVKLTGKSANNFVREFRLHKALALLHKQKGNISEISYETGFNSQAYFSKCFKDKYGMLPSKYLQHHII